MALRRALPRAAMAAAGSRAAVLAVGKFPMMAGYLSQGWSRSFRVGRAGAVYLADDIWSFLQALP
jgi:hypothetical protein